MDSPRLDRRAFLAAAGVALLATACGGGSGDGGGLGGEGAGLDPSAPAPTATPGPVVTTPPTTTPPGPAAFVVRATGGAPQVALTFHTDGDLAVAEQILATLSDRQAPMTAFVVGQWLDANPTWARRIADDGHELANHTYTHPSFAALDAATMRTEIERTRDLLVRLTGRPGTLFRPSGTADGTEQPSDAVLTTAGAAGYPVVLGFDVDPLDYQDPGPTVIAQRTLAAVRAGSVVSLHFGHTGTAAALPAILDGLSQRRLTPVTVSELLGRD